MKEVKKTTEGLGEITEGNGTRENPFVVSPTSCFVSGMSQKCTIDHVYGPGEYSEDGRQRRYYESPRGAPNNKDLCEHILVISGTSVWFDLSEVTKYESEHPNASMESLKAMGASSSAVEKMKQEYSRRANTGTPSHKPTGCLGMVVLGGAILTMICIIVARVAVSGGS